MKTDTQMTILSFLAYADFYESDIEKLEKKVREALLSAKATAGIEDVVWGPAADKKALEIQSSCLAYAVRHPDDGGSPQYTFAIRGTNPISIAAWLFQDLNVGELVSWKVASKNARSPEDARISRATFDSFERHRGLRSGGKTFLEWLKAILAQADARGIRLNVTGHSLGGLMSSTFALWLHDELVAAGLDGRVDLRVYSFAGPTAGNEAFAQYLDAELTDRYTCFVNELDIATHVWVEDDMRRILPDLYGRKIKPAPWEADLLDKFVNLIAGKGYAAPKRRTKVKAKPARNPLLRDYLVQAAFQHVVPYLTSAVLAAPEALGQTATALLGSPARLPNGEAKAVGAAVQAPGAPQLEAVGEYLSGRRRAGSLFDFGVTKNVKK